MTWRDSEAEDSYLIDEVSRRVGLSQKRIREYEKGRLIRPKREPRTNNRRYTAKDIRQIQRIKALIHEHGFTVACLRYFLSSAPCWVVYECTEKEICPFYRNPRIPCYEAVEKAADSGEAKNCSRCPVFLNRDQQKIRLLEKP